MSWTFIIPVTKKEKEIFRGNLFRKIHYVIEFLLLIIEFLLLIIY